ncbi:MAG: hypothetical protein MUD01_14955 [Chloroflexaceae bacterium]|jgi:hypothetical protein|nr:hypothetical protein [Chloroflexaceae bacterium]
MGWSQAQAENLSIAPRRALRHWPLHLLALFGYLLLTLLILAPALPTWTTAIPGGLIANTDGWQHVWHLWWVQRALANGSNPFFTPLLYYPQGAELYLQPLNASTGLLLAPITALFGPVAAYNTAAALAFVLAGMAGYGLALRVCGNHLAAFVGGLVFTFAPFHLTKLWDGQLELVQTQWLALYVLLLLRTLEDQRRSDLPLAGLTLALIGYTSWYYFLFALTASGLLLLLNLTAASFMRRLLRMAGVGALALLLLAPVLIPGLLSAYGPRQSLPEVNPADIPRFSANLLDFVLPTYLHPLWGETVFDSIGHAWQRTSGDWNVAPGYSVLALALLGCLVAWRLAWRWAVFGTVALLLALGPVLQVGPWRTELPLPYALLLQLPGAEVGRRPLHLAVLLSLALAVLAALAVGWLLQQRRGPIWLVLALGLLAFELAPPHWTRWPDTVHPAYRLLAEAPGAVLEVPPPRYKVALPQKAQLLHGQPLLGGYLAREPDYSLVKEVPGLRQLWKMHPEAPQAMAAAPDDPLVALHALGIRHVVVRWEEIDAEDRAEVEAALSQALPGVAPLVADGTLSLYRVPVVAPRPLLSFVGPGWYGEEEQHGRRWRWMAERGEILLINPDSEPTPVTISMGLQSYARSRDLTLTLNGELLHTMTVEVAESEQRLNLMLPPGLSRLTLQAPAEEETGERGRGPVSIVVIDMTLEGTAKR